MDSFAVASIVVVVVVAVIISILLFIKHLQWTEDWTENSGYLRNDEPIVACVFCSER